MSKLDNRDAEKAEKEAERWLEQLNNVDAKKDKVSETVVTIIVQTSSVVFGLVTVFGTELVDQLSFTFKVLFFTSLILMTISIFFGFWIYLKKVWFWDRVGDKINEVYKSWSQARQGKISNEEANKVEEDVLQGRVTQSSPSGPLLWQVFFLAAGIFILMIVLSAVLLI